MLGPHHLESTQSTPEPESKLDREGGPQLSIPTLFGSPPLQVSQLSTQGVTETVLAMT